MTYGQLAVIVNCYARWALAQGIAADDRVCLMMLNQPEYVAIWLGIFSVEGNFMLYNCEGKRGAIGRIPPFLAHRFNIQKLIRWYSATNEPMARDRRARLKAIPTTRSSSC